MLTGGWTSTGQLRLRVGRMSLCSAAVAGFPIVMCGGFAMRVTTHGYPPDLTAGQWDDVLARISYGLRVDPDAPPGSAQANARVVARALVAQHWDSLWD